MNRPNRHALVLALPLALVVAFASMAARAQTASTLETAPSAETAPSGETASGVETAPSEETAPPVAPALEGSWYVLIHYRDRTAPDPDGLQWLDRVWHFERKGSRLHWTHYPTVIFRDPRGRFEMLDRERRARVLHAWEPSPEQRAEIRDGLRVQPRGVREKSLRGSRERGYRSAGSLRTASTSVIGYAEEWTIEQVKTLPVFTRSARMGSARTETLEGVTRFRVETIAADGREMAGLYERDGEQEGRFRMWRSAPVVAVDERPQDGPPEPSARFLASRLLGPERFAEALEQLARDATLEALRAELRRRIELAMRDAGEDPEPHAEWVDRLVAVSAERLREGERVEALEALWTQGRLLR